jgi:hypothetical protein
MRIITLLVILSLLVGCATPMSPMPPPPRLYLPAGEPVPEPVPMPVTPPQAPGPSTAKVIGTILLLPIVIPVYAAVFGLLILASASGGRGYGGGVSCKGKIYADGTKWKSSCY